MQSSRTIIAHSGVLVALQRSAVSGATNSFIERYGNAHNGLVDALKRSGISRKSRTERIYYTHRRTSFLEALECTSRPRACITHDVDVA